MLPNAIFKSYQKTPPGVLDRFNSFKNTLSVKATATGYDLLMYDIIGIGCIELEDVAAALATAGGAPLRVRVNSPGGDAMVGFGIKGLLSSYEGPISAIIDGCAASAAAFLIMAADTIEMQPESFMMIHNSYTLTIGNRHALKAQVDALTKIDEAQARIFSEKTGMSVDMIAPMLDQETWMDAKEAVEFGFADGIVDHSPQKSDATDDIVNAMVTDFQFEKRRKQLAARLLNTRN